MLLGYVYIDGYRDCPDTGFWYASFGAYFGALLFSPLSG